MKTVTVKLGFSVAKRLLDYEGKCNYLHGYFHMAEFTFSSSGNAGIVADFNELKEELSNWLDKNWDHNVILNKQDKPLGNAIEDLTGQKVFYLDKDPTAENIAEYLKEKICPELFPDLSCTRIRLYDTPDEYVEVN